MVVLSEAVLRFAQYDITKPDIILLIPPMRDFDTWKAGN